MKNFWLIVLTFSIFSIAAFGQADPTMPQLKKKTIDEIKKQIDSSSQKKNLTARFDEKANRSLIATTRFILGRQDMVQDSGGETASFRTSVPSWEVMVNTAFETPDLTSTLNEFAWRFNIYNPRFPMDAEFKIKVDDEEMTFKPVKSGRVTVNLAVSDGVFQQDKTSNTIGRNTGNVSDTSKPVYIIYVLTRSDIDRILRGNKVKLSLNKQYEGNLQKDIKASVDLMLNVTTVP